MRGALKPQNIPGKETTLEYLIRTGRAVPTQLPPLLTTPPSEHVGLTAKQKKRKKKKEKPPAPERLYTTSSLPKTVNDNDEELCHLGTECLPDVWAGF